MLRKKDFSLIGVLAAVCALALASCSTASSNASHKAAGTSSSSATSSASRATSSSSATSSASAGKPTSCQAAFATELKDSVAGGAAWRDDLKQPGSPIVPSAGAPNPTALGQAMPLQQDPLANVCGYVTTSFIAYDIELIEKIISYGAPLPGCTASGAPQQSPAALSPCEQSELTRIALHGSSSTASPSPTSVQVQMLSTSPSHATMTVTGSFAGGSASYTLDASKIGGRWFASAFGSGTGSGAP